MHRDVDRVIVGVLVGTLEPGEPEQRVGVALHAGGHLADQAVDLGDIDGAVVVDGEPGLAQRAIDVIDDRGRVEQFGLEPAAAVLAADARDVRLATGVDLALEAARDLDEALRLDARFGDIGMLARKPVRAT